MSSNSADILDAALSLSEEERATLAYQLLQSLKPPTLVSEEDLEFEAELERRVDDYEAGRSDAADWEEVAPQLQAKLQERDSS